MCRETGDPTGVPLRTYRAIVLGHATARDYRPRRRSLQPFETAPTAAGRSSSTVRSTTTSSCDGSWKAPSRSGTTSDTEVLLAAFREWGVGCFNRLRGMFAFCIYDAWERRALLARDHFGQKPLHYAKLGDELVFASEVKGLIAAGLRPQGDRVAWSQYLTQGLFDYDRRTFFEGAWSLLPGEYAWIDGRGAIETHRYYDVRLAGRSATGRGQVDPQELRRLTAEVVALHMRSDVPVGISLSGGFDSAAVLAGLEISGALHGRTRAYSVVFPPTIPRNAGCAKRPSTMTSNSTCSTDSPTSFGADLTAMMYHLEGPIGGLMNCGLSRVVRAAREDGTIVLLGGMGLDEIFGGYRNVHEIYVRGRLREHHQDAEAVLAEYAQAYGLTPEVARRRLTDEFDFRRSLH